MAITYCKTRSGNVFPFWEINNRQINNEGFTPNLNHIGDLKKFSELIKEVSDLNIEKLEEWYAIMIDEINGPYKIEKSELSEELKKYMVSFPLKSQ